MSNCPSCICRYAKIGCNLELCMMLLVQRSWNFEIRQHKYHLFPKFNTARVKQYSSMYLTVWSPLWPLDAADPGV
ncbi:unnamed protein product [Acanthoscelides obtectus]|uniref:Uncharacterized protein n=1 Tax=Acanthoscelides obtectus TaxID=200917 RepID=A0A9P0JUR0_ACAOB|nr:unnamed protein product [Acanthoscelides obtectus]CAK1625211.1 hypothetical protein AOBTE_LOCUS3035 [Acanthoscelides obtectus]